MKYLGWNVFNVDLNLIRHWVKLAHCFRVMLISSILWHCSYFQT